MPQNRRSAIPQTSGTPSRSPANTASRRDVAYIRGWCYPIGLQDLHCILLQPDDGADNGRETRVAARRAGLVLQVAQEQVREQGGPDLPLDRLLVKPEGPVMWRTAAYVDINAWKAGIVEKVSINSVGNILRVPLKRNSTRG